MEKIRWGIIGCGDVTELKSGPAFNKVPDSELIAVMRRDAAKAEDYARRHGVPKWYDHAEYLINDPEVNAIYVATPPGTHELYGVAALQAGKPVYVEKPMAVNTSEAARLAQVAETTQVKLVVAHYRRAQPMFNKVKELLSANAIGKITTAVMKYATRPPSAAQMLEPKMAWRLDPATSGGGLFHDLAPHQLGLMLFFFGSVKSAYGKACNKGGLYGADDTVEGAISFENNVDFTGSWNFIASGGDETDECTITGTGGEIRFAVFGKYQLEVRSGSTTTIIPFEPLQHVQQPMIAKVVQYFLGREANPCPPQEGTEVMRLMHLLTAH